MAVFPALHANASMFGTHPAAEPRSNGQPISASRNSSKAVQGLQIRVAGVALIAVAVLSIRTLMTSVHSGRIHPATPSEFALIFIGFITACIGNALLWEGNRINEPCDVSERWRRHP